MVRTILALLLVSGPAWAQLAPAKDDAPAADPTPDTARWSPSASTPAKRLERKVSYSHKGQLLLGLKSALGLRAIIAYDDEDFCGDTDPQGNFGNARVCTGRAPFSLDFEVGYGLTDRIDAIVETRIGVEGDFSSTRQGDADGPRMFFLSPGFRFFFADAGRAKLFTTAQLVLDFSGYEDASGSERGFDFGIRNHNGIWFDIERAYGFFIYAGETLTFGRWLRAELEVGAGVSVRFF